MQGDVSLHGRHPHDSRKNLQTTYEVNRYAIAQPFAHHPGHVYIAACLSQAGQAIMDGTRNKKGQTSCLQSCSTEGTEGPNH
eukprot:3166818-Alexandrium_andersonii.AAC.1